MKFLDEYRAAEPARRYDEAIHALVTRPWSLMEICGGQTHAIVRFGIDELPENHSVVLPSKCSCVALASAQVLWIVPSICSGGP